MLAAFVLALQQWDIRIGPQNADETVCQGLVEKSLEASRNGDAAAWQACYSTTIDSGALAAWQTNHEMTEKLTYSHPISSLWTYGESFAQATFFNWVESIDKFAGSVVVVPSLVQVGFTKDGGQWKIKTWGPLFSMDPMQPTPSSFIFGAAGQFPLDPLSFDSSVKNIPPIYLPCVSYALTMRALQQPDYKTAALCNNAAAYLASKANDTLAEQYVQCMKPYLLQVWGDAKDALTAYEELEKQPALKGEPYISRFLEGSGLASSIAAGDFENALDRIARSNQEVLPPVYRSQNDLYRSLISLLQNDPSTGLALANEALKKLDSIPNQPAAMQARIVQSVAYMRQSILVHKGDCQAALGDAAALDTFDLCIRMAKENSMTPASAGFALIHKGMAMYDLGRLEDALAAFEEAKQVLGSDVTTTAPVQDALAAARFFLYGRLAATFDPASLQQSDAQMDAGEALPPPTIGPIWFDFVKIRDHLFASTYITRNSINLVAETSDSYNPGTANFISGNPFSTFTIQRSLVHSVQGDLQKAFQAALTGDSARASSSASDAVSMASTLHLPHFYQECRRAAAEALILAGKKMEAGDLIEADLKETHDPILSAQCQLIKGELEQTVDKETANKDFLGAIQKAEWLRQQNQDPVVQHELLDQFEPAYDGRVDYLLSKGDVQEAWKSLESWRGRVLLSAASESATKPTPYQEGQLNTLDSAVWLSEKYYYSNAESTKEGALRKSLFQARTARDLYSDSIRIIGGADSKEVPSTDLAADLKLILSEAPDAAVLEYSLEPNGARLFVALPGATEEAPLTTACLSLNVNQKDLRSFNLACASANGTRREPGTYSRAGSNANADSGLDAAGLGQSLYKALIEPANRLIGNSKHLIIIPDANMAMVPFQALIDTRGKYLIEQFEITYGSSVSVLAHSLRLPRPSANQPLVVGGVSFPSWLVPLNSSGAEADYIAKELGSPVLKGPSATRTAILEKMRTASVIHLATHGLVDPNPLYSAIASADGDGNDLIQARDLLGERLHARAVVLSACESAASEAEAGDALGLSWAFEVAGCPTTVVSQWSVNDPATASLMQSLYHHLGNHGQTGWGSALTQVMRDFILHPPSAGYDRPFFWAPFVLVGDWR